MKYARFKDTIIKSDYRIEFEPPYSTETLIKRIRDLKNHGYEIIDEAVKHSRVKAESMSSETVEGPLAGDFHLKTPGKTEYMLSVREFVETKLTVEIGDDAQFSDFMSMIDLILGPKPRKKQK